MADNMDGSVYIETGLDAEGFRQGSEKLISAMETLGKQIDNLCINMEKAFSGATVNLRNIGATASRTASDVNNATQQTQQSTQRATGSADAYSQAMENARIAAQNMAGGQEEVDRAIAKTQAELERLNARQEKQRILAEQARQAQIAQIREEAKAEMEAMAGWEKMAQWSKDAIAQEYEKTIQEKIAKLGAAEDSQAFRSIQYDIDITSAKLDGLLAKKEQLGEQKLDGVTVEFGKLGDGIQRVADKLGHAALRALGFVKNLSISAIRTFANAIRDAAEGAAALARNLGRISLNIFSKALTKAVSKLKSFSRETKNVAIDSNALVKSLTGIKRLLLTRIKRTFISSLIKDVTEGLQKLAQFSSEFDRTMSRIKNSATQLKGSIAVAVGNIISTLEPIILKVIDLINKAVDGLNQFFALVSGKNTYVAAKKGTDDYAKSTDKATKSQKKLNAELYSFDELTRQSDKSDNSSDSDDDTSGIQYETRAIDLPKGIQDWIKRLKEAWQKGDWYGVGAVIAEGLNKALEVADNWINNKFRPWAVKWASRIAQIINGFVDNFNWELLGKTIADGINAVFDALETFLDGVNWLNLGAGIGRAIKSWFDNIEWDRIGRVFAKKWNALLNTIKGIVTTPGFWQSIGRSIGDFVKSWFETIDIDAIADIVIAVLNGIPQAIEEFLSKDPFNGVAQKISNAINRVVQNVEWEYLVGEIADLLISLVDHIRQILGGIDWDNVFDSLRNMGVVFVGKIINYLGSIDWGLVASTLANGFNQLIGMINDIISQPGFWESVGTNIANAVQGWFGSISYDDIATLLINLINGATTALETFLASDGFAGIGEAITNAIQRVVNEVRWGDLLNVLTTLFKNVLNGLLDVADTVNWPEVANKIGSALADLPWARIFETLWNILKGLIEGLLSSNNGRIILAVGAGILALKTGILSSVSLLGAGLLTSLLGKIPAFIGKLISPIITGLTSTLPGVITGAAPAITGALSSLGAVILPAATVALGVFDVAAIATMGAQWIGTQKELNAAITQETQTVMGSIIKCYESGGQETVTKWMEMAYGVKSTGEGMEADLYALAERLAELQGKSADEIYAQFTQNADLMKMKADESGDAIAQSVETSSGKVTEAAQGMTENIGIAAQELDEKITQPVDEMSQSVSASAESMNTNASGSTNEMGENMKGTWNDVDITWQEKLTSIETALQTSMQNMIAIITQGATDQTQPFFDHWGDVMDFIGLVLQSIEEKLTLSLETQATTINTALTTNSQAIRASQESIQTATDTFLTAVAQRIQTGLDDMLSVTEASLTTAENTVSAKMDSISAKVSAAMDKIGSTFEQKWNAIVTKFETTLQSMETKAKTSMENLKKITASAIDAIKQQPWNTVGDAIVKGIGAGVNSSWPWLESLVRQRAQQLLQAAKASLGIASPSKLFKEQIGENIGYGWAEGIEATKGDVLETVSNISDAIAKEAEGTNVGTNAGGVLDVGMQTVLSGLSEVAETFLTIADTLKRIGGFSMPQIAAGTVVPYKTRAAAESAPNEGPDEVDTHLTGIEMALQRLLELVQLNGNTQQVVKVIIDGREVFEAVVNENNRAINRTGASPIRV